MVKAKGSTEKKKANATGLNTLVTQAQALEKCQEWLENNPDKVLHLYGMMTLGLCDPKKPDDKTGDEEGGSMPPIPKSKSTLGQVSAKHINKCVVEWLPEAADWITKFGGKLAHELFYYSTCTHAKVSVHEHQFDRFLLFYTIRYQAFGSRLQQLKQNLEVSTTLAFPWGQLGWFTMHGDGSGMITELRCDNADHCSTPCSSNVDSTWAITQNYCMEGAHLESADGLTKLHIKSIYFKQVGGFKNFSVKGDFSLVKSAVAEMATNMGLEVGDAWASGALMATPAKSAARRTKAIAEQSPLATNLAEVKATPKKRRVI